MTAKDAVRLVKLLQVAYPSFQVEPGDEKRGIPGTMEFWENALAPYESADCLAALDYFKTHEPKRQFAPGLFEFEAEVRKVISARNDAQKAAQERKRITHKHGDNPETFERVFKDIGGQNREFVRATTAQRMRYAEEARQRGWVKEVFNLPGGDKGFRYTVPSFSAATGKSVQDLVADLSKAKSMPEPEAEDYSERYEWGSVWETMDESARLSQQDDTPITPADFRRKREAL